MTTQFPTTAAKAVIIDDQQAVPPPGCAQLQPQDGAAEVLRILTDVIPFRIGLIKGVQCVDASCQAILSACKNAADWMLSTTAPNARTKTTVATGMDGVKTVTFASEHLIVIEIALDSHIVLLEECVKAAPDSMAQRDALDVARQALELVQ